MNDAALKSKRGDGALNVPTHRAAERDELQWPPGTRRIQDAPATMPKPLCAQLSFYYGLRPFLLSGAGGAGKTTAALSIAVAYAAGSGSALGGALKLEGSGPVIYCAYESSRMFRPLLKDIARGAAYDDYSSLPIRDLDPPQLGLAGSRDKVAAFAAKLAEHTFLIIDTLASATRALATQFIDENSTEFATILHRAEEIAMEKNCAVMVLCHEGHKGGRERGTSALRDASDNVSSLSADAKGIRTLTSIKSNHEYHDPIRFRTEKHDDGKIVFVNAANDGATNAAQRDARTDEDPCDGAAKPRRGPRKPRKNVALKQAGVVMPALRARWAELRAAKMSGNAIARKLGIRRAVVTEFEKSIEAKK